MEIRPITFRAACAFVLLHHRHNKPPRGHKFSVALHDGDGELVGVAMCGRPVARHLDDGRTLEINRTCVVGAPNGNSMLYGACRRAALAMGYRRVVTYTRADESGASLRAAGFDRAKDLPARAGWADSSVKLKHLRDDLFEKGDGEVARVLWQEVIGEPKMETRP